MEFPTIARLLLVLARIVGLTAAVLTGGGYGVSVFSTPDILPAAMWNFSFALLAIWGLLKSRPSLLFLAFFCSFVIAGWYTSILDGLLEWSGIDSLLYLISGSLIVLSLRFAEPRYREVETGRILT